MLKLICVECHKNHFFLYAGQAHVMRKHVLSGFPIARKSWKNDTKGSLIFMKFEVWETLLSDTASQTVIDLIRYSIRKRVIKFYIFHKFFCIIFCGLN